MEQINIKTLEIVRNIRDAHYEQLKDKSRKERILFYREKADRLHNRLLQTAEFTQGGLIESATKKINRSEGWSGDSAADVAGMGKSGVKDGSVHHDRYIYGLE